ncbi:hypothetical protein [Paludifilum halophilum]|uniref:DUF3021 domain-containing protein n=1 Tax=Paludifilum halophilum TaxID=1642702 RepID=A0A235B7Y0_9BACL|nr:hypothetical protein [Paludifilum halophilum]OYD08361.1 hypothetical protein CHM34_05830 [Paludifilum halophilum]
MKDKLLPVLIIAVIQYICLLWVYTNSPLSYEDYGGKAFLAFDFTIITALIVLFYGVPISLLSDYLTTNKPLRWFWAMLIHAIGGAFGVVLLSVLLSLPDFKINYSLVIFGFCVAFLYWVIDEVLKIRKKKRETIDAP